MQHNQEFTIDDIGDFPYRSHVTWTDPATGYTYCECQAVENADGTPHTHDWTFTPPTVGFDGGESYYSFSRCACRMSRRQTHHPQKERHATPRELCRLRSLVSVSMPMVTDDAEGKTWWLDAYDRFSQQVFGA